MKRILLVLIFISLMFWAGCAAKKTTISTKAVDVKTKGNTKPKVNEPKEVLHKAVGTAKTTSIKEDKTKETVPVLPTSTVMVERVPIAVEDAFKVSYPLVEYPAWNIEKTGENPISRSYHALFKINDKRQTVSYDKVANVIGSRAEITPEQLPPLLNNAMKAKYPEARVLTVYTYKNTQKQGAYLVNIIPYLGAKEMEVILTDMGEIMN